MKSLKKIIATASCAAGTFMFAAIAFAEEAAHGGHEEITFMGDWLPRLVNFAIIATVVVYFTRKPIRDFFAARSADIAKAMQALVEEGKKVAQEVQQQVKMGIDIEVQKARTALAVEASLLSLDLAEGRIKEKISGQDHERIVKEYITKVGGRG